MAVESVKTSRTSFSGLDPERLQKRFNRPSSAPMKKPTAEDNKSLSEQAADPTSVDLRKGIVRVYVLVCEKLLH